MSEDIPSTYTILTFPAKDLPDQYKGIVFAKWIRSLHKGNDVFNLIQAGTMMKNYHAYLERLFQQPECEIRLAVLSDDRDVVLGFSVYRGAVLDYVFVQSHARNKGIGFNLVPEAITHYTHTTRIGAHWGRHRYNEWIFNPFA